MVGVVSRFARSFAPAACAAVLFPAMAFAQPAPPTAPTVPADYNAELCMRVNAAGALASAGKEAKAAALLLSVCARPVERASLLAFNTALLADAGEGGPIGVDPTTGELRLAEGAGPEAEQRLAELRGRAPAQLQPSARLQAFALQAVKDARRGR